MRAWNAVVRDGNWMVLDSAVVIRMNTLIVEALIKRTFPEYMATQNFESISARVLLEILPADP